MRRLIAPLITILWLAPVAAAELNQRNYIPAENIIKLELLSVSPQPSFSVLGKLVGSKIFHSYPVLGSMEIEGRPSIEEITTALNTSLEPHIRKQCLFVPRHALRIFYKDSEIDYVICYKCGDVQKFHGGDDTKPELYSVKNFSKSVLDRYLTEAKIPLAP